MRVWFGSGVGEDTWFGARSIPASFASLIAARRRQRARRENGTVAGWPNFVIVENKKRARTLPSFCKPRRNSLCSSSVHGTPGCWREVGEVSGLNSGETTSDTSPCHAFRGASYPRQNEIWRGAKKQRRTLLAFARGRGCGVGEVAVGRANRLHIRPLSLRHLLRGLRFPHALGRSADQSL